jgi:hypothetical protein
MLAELLARSLRRVILSATRRGRSHDLLDGNFRSAPVVSRHPTAHVTLGHDTDQLEVFPILDYRRAAAA